MHNLFSTIYFRQEQKLNPNKYSDQEINMNYFIQAIDHDMIMYEKFQYLNMHGFL
jgi:hypothetical protein